MKQRFFLLLFFALVLSGESNASFKMTARPRQSGLFEMTEFCFESKQIAGNPFTEITVKGIFIHDNGKEYNVDGFCDTQDGKIFRLRFLPQETGKYTYRIHITQDGKSQEFKGTLAVAPSENKGLVRVDKEYPSHFMWDGTGEHYFWNGTTAYWLMGWKDETIIRESIDRLASLDINRIRVAISGRQYDGSRWYEPLVKESEGFTFKLNPWVATNPESVDEPGFDVTRFNVEYWQKLDRLVAYAREKGVVVSLIFYVDGLEHGCDPFKKENMGGEDEKRYYRYAAARYAAYNNIMWDVANEYHIFRNEAWVQEMGPFLYSADPYKHLISVHGHGDFPFRNDEWVNMVLYQSWDECGGYDFMMQRRYDQQESGRMLPQINEEYGYEGHYPPWGCGPVQTKEVDGRSGDNRRRLAWEIYMAGGYQTTGERADEGTGAGNDSGGGWINGRGNDSMTMLKGYGIIKRTFEELEYWKLEPASGLVSNGNLCLAEVGRQYLVYSRVQHCRLQLPAGQRYSVTMINPRTGERTELGVVDSDKSAGAWQYPRDLEGDWAFVLKRVDESSQRAFLYAGEGKVNNVYLVEGEEIKWHYAPAESTGEISDACLMDNGNILLAYMHGICEINPQKEVLWNVAAPGGCEIHTIQPVGKEHVVYVQNGLPAKVVVMHIPTKKTVREFTLTTKNPSPDDNNRWVTVHIQFRNARLTSWGTLIVSHMDSDKVCEYDSYGNLLWTMDVVSPWSACPLKNGNLLITSNHGFVREVNKEKQTVWEIDLKNNPQYGVTAPQVSYRLDNGNTIINNWFNEFDQPSVFDAANPPLQAIEVNQNKEVVWKLCAWEEPFNLGPSTIIQPLDKAVVREQMFFGDVR